MTIARILAAKGRDVVTTQPQRTLAEVAEVLVAKNIGAVVIADVQDEAPLLMARQGRPGKSRFEFLLSKSLRKYGSGFVTTGVDPEAATHASPANGRTGWKAVIRSSRLNDASAQIQTCSGGQVFGIPGDTSGRSYARSYAAAAAILLGHGKLLSRTANGAPTF